MVVAAQEADHARGGAALSRPVYDVPHAVRPWGWKVSAYLWTKSISAGALLVAAFAGSESWGSLFTGVAPALSLLFLAITTALLVVDLKRPERFAYILLKPNWRSWLVWGAWILMAFGVTGAVWLVGRRRRDDRACSTWRSFRRSCWRSRPPATARSSSARPRDEISGRARSCCRI